MELSAAIRGKCSLAVLALEGLVDAVRPHVDPQIGFLCKGLSALWHWTSMRLRSPMQMQVRI